MQNLSARNPLSIIALFISLIYGVSALLLGLSVDKLSAGNQERLVWFVVIFPCAVLAAFLWLVAKHHKKLYGPGDYRTDEGFLSAGANPALVGQKYRDEASPEPEVTQIGAIEGSALEPIEELDVDEPDGQNADAPPEVEDRPAPEPPSHSSNMPRDSASYRQTSIAPSAAAEFYMLEGLVLQELQGQFNAPLRRDVQVSVDGRRYTIDGLIEEPGMKTVVEIKFVRNGASISRRVRDGLAQLDRAVALLARPAGENVRGLLALVADDSAAIRAIQKLASDGALASGHSIRFFSRPELLSKYGITIP
jgi:hypothetical protein